MYRSRGYQTKAVNVARLSSRRSSAADRQSVKRDYWITCEVLRAQCKLLYTGYHVVVTRVTRVAQSKSARWWQQHDIYTADAQSDHMTNCLRYFPN